MAKRSFATSQRLDGKFFAFYTLPSLSSENRKVCISHNDLDGVACQYLQAELTPAAQRFYLGYLDLDSWHQCLDHVLRSERQNIHFMDLGMNRGFGENGILAKIRQINQKHQVQWDDHHLWLPEEYGLERGIEWNINSDAQSTAELIYLRAKSSSPFSRQLVYLAKISDQGPFFSGHDKTTLDLVTKLGDLLCSGYDPEKAVQNFLGYQLWSEEFESQLEQYHPRKSSALAEMERGIKTLPVNGYILASCLADPCLFPKPAREFLTAKAPQADAAILMFDGTKCVTLYSQKINVGKIALAFGGGGHEHSAGFLAGEIITPKNRTGIEMAVLGCL